MEVFSPRQTNMGLFVQMHEKGFSTADIRRLQQCYSTACGMFNGRYRKTGRPFICHSVGVASSVARFSRDPDMVIAGILTLAQAREMLGVANAEFGMGNAESNSALGASPVCDECARFDEADNRCRVHNTRRRFDDPACRFLERREAG